MMRREVCAGFSNVPVYLRSLHFHLLARCYSYFSVNTAPQ
jgi:hypothetical protein